MEDVNGIQCLKDTKVKRNLLILQAFHICANDGDGGLLTYR